MTEPELRASALRAADALRMQLDRSLGELISPGSRAALINYPNHHNVGDPALYLGTVRALRRIGVRITYRCGIDSYSRRVLEQQLEHGTDLILVNGGGNLGDQYPQHQLRERVMLDFPGVKTIQLPQSIWFERPEKLESFAAIVRQHRDFTLLLRDEESMRLASAAFDAPTRLVPDLAFGLGPIRRPDRPSTDIAWLRRRDREAAVDPAAPGASGATMPFDWLSATAREAVGGPTGRWLLRANGWLARRVAAQPWLWRALAATYDPLAARRLAYGCRLLARGRIVVTDRLHGVILAVLMGIPVVAVDNRTGKVSSFIETWLDDVPAVRMAPDHDLALELARSMVA